MDIKKLVDDVDSMEELVSMERELRVAHRRLLALKDKMSGSIAVLTARDAEIDADTKIIDKAAAKAVYKPRKDSLQAMVVVWDILK